MKIDCHSMSDSVTTHSDHTYCPHALITPTNHNFQHYISYVLQTFEKKKNVTLKIVVSGCDQCVWPVRVVVVCGHWVGHGMAISFHVCLRHPYHVVIHFSATSRSIINPTSHFIFCKNVFCLLFLSFFVNKVFLA